MGVGILFSVIVGIYTMQFVKTEDLKVDMRLARPIYNKKGVLLFDRNSKLTRAGIDMVRNFGLLGIYILEPAEPLPPMSEDDFEFERFQTMGVFAIQEELERLRTEHRQQKIQNIANMVIRNYGRQDSRVNFYQNLRSGEDFLYKHSLNVSILCALICHRMNLYLDEQLQTVQAAIVHDIGKMTLSKELICGVDLEPGQQDEVDSAIQASGELIEMAFTDGIAIKRICMQAERMKRLLRNSGNQNDNLKFVNGAKVLLVANRYDELTGMSINGTAESEVKAILELQAHPEIYAPKVVDALVQSIKILFPGVSVELNTGEKALVLVENRQNILRPVVLSFQDNTIIDLSLRVNSDVEIVDIMKTMDNRYIMDIDKLKELGYY